MVYSILECNNKKDYINRMVMMSIKAKKISLNIDDEIVASLMLAELLENFKPLVLAVKNF